MFNELELTVLSLRFSEEELSAWQTMPDQYAREALKDFYNPTTAWRDCLKMRVEKIQSNPDLHSLYADHDFLNLIDPALSGFEENWVDSVKELMRSHPEMLERYTKDSIEVLEIRNLYHSISKKFHLDQQTDANLGESCWRVNMMTRLLTANVYEVSSTPEERSMVLAPFHTLWNQESPALKAASANV